MIGNLTETIWIKHTFNEREIVELAQKMARAESIISEKADELKSVSTAIKVDIAVQEGILHACAERLRSGYEMRPRECVVTYEKGTAVYADKNTGEIVESRPMTQEEQLRLSGKRIDAEQIIRQASEEEA